MAVSETIRPHFSGGQHVPFTAESSTTRSGKAVCRIVTGRSMDLHLRRWPGGRNLRIILGSGFRLQPTRGRSVCPNIASVWLFLPTRGIRSAARKPRFPHRRENRRIVNEDRLAPRTRRAQRRRKKRFRMRYRRSDQAGLEKLFVCLHNCSTT